MPAPATGSPQRPRLLGGGAREHGDLGAHGLADEHCHGTQAAQPCDGQLHAGLQVVEDHRSIDGDA